MAFLPVSQMYCLHSSQFQERIAIHFVLLRLVQPSYISHSSASHVHNLIESQLYTYLGKEGHFVLPLSVAEFDWLCTQFEVEQLSMHFGSLVWYPNPMSNKSKNA